MLAPVQVLDSLVSSWAVLNGIAVLGCLMLLSENFSHLLGPPCPLLCHTFLKNVICLFCLLLTNKVAAFEVAVGVQVLLELFF